MDCREAAVVNCEKGYEKELDEMSGTVRNLRKGDLQNVVESYCKILRPVRKNDVDGFPAPEDRSKQRDYIGRRQGQKQNDRHFRQGTHRAHLFMRSFDRGNIIL